MDGCLRALRWNERYSDSQRRIRGMLYFSFAILLLTESVVYLTHFQSVDHESLFGNERAIGKGGKISRSFSR